MLASTYEVMALSCSRWPFSRGPPPQLGAERKKGMQLWRPVRGSEDGIWERAKMAKRMKGKHNLGKVRGDTAECLVLIYVVLSWWSMVFDPLLNQPKVEFLLKLLFFTLVCGKC